MSAAAGSLKFRGEFLRKAVAVHAKQLNFASVSSVKFTYNPFCQNTNALRETAFQMSVPKMRLSNPGCTFKVFVMSDRCKPTMEVSFTNGHNALFKTENLNTYEILQQFNNLCIVNAIISKEPAVQAKPAKNGKKK